MTFKSHPAVAHLPRHGRATADDTAAAAQLISEQLAAAGFDDIRQELLTMEPVPAVCVLATTARPA